MNHVMQSNDLLYQLGLVDFNKYLDVIKREIAGQPDYQKSCDDSCSQEAVKQSRLLSWSLTPGQSKDRICDRLVDFLQGTRIGTVDRQDDGFTY